MHYDHNLPLKNFKKAYERYHIFLDAIEALDDNFIPENHADTESIQFAQKLKAKQFYKLTDRLIQTPKEEDRIYTILHRAKTEIEKLFLNDQTKILKQVPSKIRDITERFSIARSQSSFIQKTGFGHFLQCEYPMREFAEWFFSDYGFDFLDEKEVERIKIQLEKQNKEGSKKDRYSQLYEDKLRFKDEKVKKEEPKEKVLLKTDKKKSIPIKSFDEYFKIEHRRKIPKLKEKFKGISPINKSYFIVALSELNYLDINLRSIEGRATSKLLNDFLDTDGAEQRFTEYNKRLLEPILDKKDNRNLKGTIHQIKSLFEK